MQKVCVQLFSAFLAKSPEDVRKEAAKRVASHGEYPENEGLITSLRSTENLPSNGC